MEKLFDYLEGLLDTIKDNGLFIFLAVLFPVLLYKFGAGEEIILDLTSRDMMESRNFFVIASFLFLGLSIWCIPTLSIYIFKAFTRVPSDRVLPILDKLLDLYNAKPKSNQMRKILQVPVRYIAVLPWIIFIISLVNVYYGKKTMIITILALAVVIKLLDYYSKILTKSFDTTFLQLKKFWEIICLVLILVFEYGILQLGVKGYYTSLIVFANITGVLLAYIFFLVKENSEDFPDGDPRKMKMIHDKTFCMHGLLLLISVGVMIFYFTKQINGTLNTVSPITIGTMIMSFYILIIELFITSQMLLANLMIKGFSDNRFRFRVYKGVVVSFALLWIILLFSSTNPHTITQNPVKDQNEYFVRENLYNHFSEWYKRRGPDPKTGELEVFLVSGQGGGSRAAYWFMSNMFELDSHRKDFYKNLYSISTVSGSSSGAQMFLASKEHYRLSEKAKRDVARNIYTRNYLSGALYGLLIGDFFETIAGLFGMQERDRNFYFQMEEQKAFLEAHKKVKVWSAKDSVKYFFSRDYMYYYNRKKSKYNIPLFFLNSAIVENGKKAVFSPVQLNAPIDIVNNGISNDYALFTLYEDAYGIYRKCDWSANKEIPMSACVNASQSFPLINAYSFLHGVGRLTDGGFFENSGTSTTQEIYTALKKYVNENKLPVKFTMINILNSKTDSDHAVNYSRASILNTATAILNNPFKGHEVLAVKQLHKQVVLMNSDGKDRIITLIPTGKYNLTRILSEKSVSKMRIDLDSVKKHSDIFRLKDTMRDKQFLKGFATQ
ncbi:hypothetical protein ACM46_15190 [Chryseobacterium angstadtii]|uniref:PNPLA domain-containing protein n=1 Tax=Chryseobacterium angstadtii TaxID=558151 RepID=A0A0J7I4U2_9FLAO|nr:hypothetical protein [Chryseobacterium angstadtii]KMQ61372.1 hypothetical protein ACM46_15190 [Chryseobacterium angstadtii]